MGFVCLLKSGIKCFKNWSFDLFIPTSPRVHQVSQCLLPDLKSPSGGTQTGTIILGLCYSSRFKGTQKFTQTN